MRNRLLSLIVLCVAVSHAAATERVFNKDFGVWHNQLNWTPNGIPTAADRVVIPEDSTCTIASGQGAVADTLFIEEDAELVVEFNATLTLDNNNNHSCSLSPHCSLSEHSHIDGDLTLAAGGWLVIAENDHIFEGDGAIVGHTDGFYIAAIFIELDLTMTNRLAVMDRGLRGAFQMVGDWDMPDVVVATFVNEGIVEGENGDAIIGTRLMNEIRIFDNEDAFWIANCNGDLHLYVEDVDPLVRAPLEGDFWHRSDFCDDGGTMWFGGSIRTCGTFILDSFGGMVLLDSSVGFSYHKFSSSSIGGPGCTTNPGTGGPGGPNCTGGWSLSGPLNAPGECTDVIGDG